VRIAEVSAVRNRHRIPAVPTAIATSLGTFGAGPPAKEHTGRVIGSRRGKHVVHPSVTVVEMDGDVDRDSLIGVKVVWKQDDGLQIRRWVQSRHGNGRAVIVR